jgi:hypothetical protein
MRFSAVRYAMRSRRSPLTDSEADSSRVFQFTSCSTSSRTSKLDVIMGHHAVTYKLRTGQGADRNLFYNSAFRYFDPTATEASSTSPESWDVIHTLCETVGAS